MIRFIEYSSFIKKIWLFFFQIGAMGGCHQLPERSFRIYDMQFPVCSRCTGVYLGQLFGIILINNNVHIDLKTSVVFLAVMLIDWLIQYIKVKESNNLRRLITGLMAGIGLISLNHHILKLFWNLMVIKLHIL